MSTSNPKVSRADLVEAFIAKFSLEHGGNVPSYRQIADALNIYPADAMKFVQRLAAKGRAVYIGKVFYLSGSKYELNADLLAKVSALPALLDEFCAARITTDRKREMYRQQKGKCWWCGQELDGIYHVDHRVARAKGGSNAIDNLCLSCPDCNVHKSDKLPHEFNGRLL